MHFILLSGGSGNRLWPLSSHSKPKQFLEFFSAPQADSQNISMVQRILYQLKEVGLINQTVISTCSSQIDTINSKIGTSIPLAIEPSLRDTYPAILLASVYLYSVKQIDPNEVVVVMPVDTYVDMDFFQYLKSLEHTINSTNASIALVGIKPSSASEKMGYILPQKGSSLGENIQKVGGFIEKPTCEIASDLISKGAIWNAGVFSFKLDFLINHIKENHLPLSYEEMIDHYESLPKISFDYKVVEKTKDMVVTTYNRKWKDIGTWDTFTEELRESVIGNGIVSSDSKNIHIINQLDLPVAVLGISDIVVVATANGILISDKKSSSRLKEITEKLKRLGE